MASFPLIKSNRLRVVSNFGHLGEIHACARAKIGSHEESPFSRARMYFACVSPKLETTRSLKAKEKKLQLVGKRVETLTFCVTFEANFRNLDNYNFYPPPLPASVLSVSDRGTQREKNWKKA